MLSVLAIPLTLATALSRAPIASPLWRELRPAVEYGTPAPSWQSHRDGRPVLLIPGLMAGDGSMRFVAAGLESHGYRPLVAAVGRNVDCSGATLGRLLEQLEAAACEHGGPLAVVGHSRGGLLGRALARRRPDLVDALVTLGTPHSDQLALHPVVLAHLLGLALLGSLGFGGLMRLSCGGGACCAAFHHDLGAPLPDGVRFLSLYSRLDGVVDWRACLDPLGRHREVAATHCGMVASGAVLDQVARALAA
jgi:triacylglycerol lipase